jgi:hypothetical protein
MKISVIEAWALRTLTRIASAQPIEDSRVELKAGWIDPQKAARRIAGHCNAARGEEILWLIGVDETGGVTGAPATELSEWWVKVQNCFDGVFPPLQDVQVEFQTKIITALCFDTTRAPFVVKNSAYGKTLGEGVDLEVPWREGTRTRSAKRSEVLLLLDAAIRSPLLEVLKGSIFVRKDSNRATDAASISIELYIVPQTADVLVFPFHKCTGQIEWNEQCIESLVGFDMDAPTRGKFNRSQAVRSLVTQFRDSTPRVTVNAREEIVEITGTEVFFRGPGKVILSVRAPIPPDVLAENARPRIQIKLNEARGQTSSLFTCVAVPSPNKEGHQVWNITA